MTRDEALAMRGAPAIATDLRRLLLRCGLRPFDAASDSEAAARIYRRCCQAGFTPRGLTDCMIAAVAWRNGDSLLSYDLDLHRVASVIGVGMDESSLRA